MNSKRRSSGTPSQESLPIWRIGLLGGSVGMLCCVGPVVLALLGVVGAGTAFVWATNLYDHDTWWFRLAGLAAMALVTWLALRRRGTCRVDHVVRLRWRLLGLLAIGAATYGLLYGATTLLGRLA